jgi:hypothetical protein
MPLVARPVGIKLFVQAHKINDQISGRLLLMNVQQFIIGVIEERFDAGDQGCEASLAKTQQQVSRILLHHHQGDLHWLWVGWCYTPMSSRDRPWPGNGAG